jgi:hypothetical protein
VADSGVQPDGSFVPAFEGQRPPFRPGNEHRVQPGNQLARTHGAHSKLTLAPRAEELADWIRDLVPSYRDADEPTVQLLALSLAQVEAAHTWIAENGLLDEHGQPRGILRHLGTMTNTAGRLADRLGMNPTARAGLGLDVARTAQAVTLTGLAAEAELERRSDRRPDEQKSLGKGEKEQSS